MIQRVKGALRSAVFVKDYSSGDRHVEAGTHGTCSNFRKGDKPAPADKATHCDVSYLEGMKSRSVHAPMAVLQFE